MSLETESLTSIRATAQAMGIKFTFNEDKRALITRIMCEAEARVPQPNRDPLEPMDMRLRTRPPLRACTQKEIYEALQPMFERGLILTFPTDDTWQVEKLIRHVDTGTLWAPLRTIMDAAKKVLERTK